VHVTVRERPGISPHLIPHLVSNTAFFQLRDLGIALPPYKEHVKECRFTPQLSANYERLKNAARKLIPLGRRTRDGHLVSSLIQALLAYPDRATQGETITDRNGVIHFELDPLPEDIVLPKEQNLIDLILTERSLNRRVLVYCTHTQTKDITARLHRICSAASIRSHILSSSVAPERRMRWITDRTKQGLDALICNPKLVATGLDLLDFPTIVWMEADYSSYLVRQASRRSWRIKQTLPVHVHYFLYKGTAQEHAWALIAAGINQALLTEGELTAEGLNQYQQPDDFMTQIVKQVLDRNPTVLSAESMFAQLATRYKQDHASMTPEASGLDTNPTYQEMPPQQPLLTSTNITHRTRTHNDTSTQLSLFAA
jgi:hypothetical protein